MGTRLGNWLVASPRVKAWFYPPLKIETPAEKYRQFNGYYFADLHEQERMLGDEPRMAFYHEAIKRHVKPGQRVIDLGTGTGILAAYAAREDVHSTEFYLDEPVDVILHEQIGDFLFDEAMVPNVCDLRDRLLKPGGLILPSQFELFCEPITMHDDRRIPYIWELTDVHGFDYSAMDRSRPQNPEYYRLSSCDLSLVKHFMGEPEPLVAVDLHTIEEDTVPLSITITRKVLRGGVIDGLAVFMKAKVDDDLVLSSSPIDPGRAPHWGFRILRLDQSSAEVGDTLEINITVEDWTDPDTWRWTCELQA